MFRLHYSLRVSCSFAAPVLAHGGGFLFGFFFCSFPHFIHALRISIHALREEGDPTELHQRLFPSAISIHALREEGDHRGNLTVLYLWLFLSTPSARRATEMNFFAIDSCELNLKVVLYCQ